MVRNLTDPDGDDTLEWQERVVDVDGDSISIDLILDQVDGSNAADSNPSWLDFTTTTNTINTDETEVLVDITADTSGLSAGSTYTFEITADDGITTTKRTFQLEVTVSYWSNGTNLFGGGQGDSIVKWNIDNPFDITGLSKAQEDSLGKNVNAIQFFNGGSEAIVSSDNTSKVHKIAFSTNYDLITAQTPSQNLSLANGEDLPYGIRIKPDGTKLYVAGGGNKSIQQYDLSTAFDLSTSTFQTSISGPSNELIFGVAFKMDDGSKIYFGQRDSSTYYEYDLSTPWELSSASQANTLDVSSDLSGAGTIAFSPDGSTVVLSSYNDDKLVQYNLSIPWDISTATKDKSVSIGANYGNLHLIFQGPSA